jgi:hypothetical protein
MTWVGYLTVHFYAVCDCSNQLQELLQTILAPWAMSMDDHDGASDRRDDTLCIHHTKYIPIDGIILDSLFGNPGCVVRLDTLFGSLLCRCIIFLHISFSLHLFRLVVFGNGPGLRLGGSSLEATSSSVAETDSFSAGLLGGERTNPAAIVACPWSERHTAPHLTDAVFLKIPLPNSLLA